MGLSFKNISSLNVTREPRQILISNINKILVQGDVLLPEQQSHFHTKFSKNNTQRSKLEQKRRYSRNRYRRILLYFEV